MKKRDFADVLFNIGILLLPYDAIHYLIPSNYAPVSIYPFFLLLIFMLCRSGHLSMNRNDRLLIMFAVYAFLVSLITAQIYMDNFNHYLEFFVTLSIGVMVYFSISIYIKYRCIEKQKDAFGFIVVLLTKAYYFPLIIGIVEVLSLNQILPANVKTIINIVFGGWHNSRPCITSFEASWASMHMLIAMSVYFIAVCLNYKRRRHVICCITAGVLFLFCASAQGVLTAVIAAGLYLLLNAYMNRKIIYTLKRLLPVLLFCLFCLGGFYFWLRQHPNTYMAARVLNFTSINSLFRNDSSVVVRVGFPIIHLLIFFDHPLFGIGGGSFREMCIVYIKKYFSYAVKLPEIRNYMITNDVNTVTSFYLGSFSEFGIIGAALFYLFLYRCIKKIKEVGDVAYRKYLCLLIAVLLSLPVQFGSWAFVPFWLCMAILNNGIASNGKDAQIIR